MANLERRVSWTRWGSYWSYMVCFDLTVYLMQQIRAAIAHGIKVPPEFRDKSVVDVIVGVYSCPSMTLLANRKFLGTSGRGRVVLRYIFSI